MSPVVSALILSGQGQLYGRSKDYLEKDGPCRQQAGGALRGIWEVRAAYPVRAVCLLKPNDAVC